MSLPNVGRYETALEHFGAPEWVELAALRGLLVTREPLRTTGPEAEQGIVWARASERRAREVAAELGARLPTAAECEAIARDPQVRIVSMCAQPPDHRMSSPAAGRRSVPAAHWRAASRHRHVRARGCRYRLGQAILAEPGGELRLRARAGRRVGRGEPHHSVRSVERTTSP